MSIQWEDSELRKLAADLGDSAERVGKEVAEVVRKNGKALQERAEQLSPVRTGALKAGWTLDVYGDGRSTDMGARVRNTTRQAFFQEHGTSNHPPQPSAGPALEAVGPQYVADMQKAAGEVL